MTRAGDLAQALAAVEQRLTTACAAAGRLREDVTLIAVTKTWPASDVVLLSELGLRAFAEARDQEAAAKARELAGRDLRWHFVGQLQTNKAASVAGYADVVQSVDRPRLVQALAVAALRAERSLDVLVQVRLDGHEGGGGGDGAAGRGGAAPAAVPALAELVASQPALRLAGVMAVAPRGVEPEAAFARLARVAARLRAAHPDATVVSAGMSGDLEAAVAQGATWVRVGAALLGSRRSPLR